MEKSRRYPEYLRSEDELFYLEGNYDVWFVNNTNEVLTKVTTNSGGCITADDDVVTLAPNSLIYEDVKPKEAVQIDELDMYIADFIIEFSVDVAAPSFGRLSLRSGAEKGGNTGATLLWKPLPPDTCDPENPSELLAPEKAASDYMEMTGNYLDKSIFLNRGDLKMDYAARRLAPSGVVLKKFLHRNGRITEYLFTDIERTHIYRTCNYEKACLFVEGLRKNNN